MEPCSSGGMSAEHSRDEPAVPRWFRLTTSLKPLPSRFLPLAVVRFAPRALPDARATAGNASFSGGGASCSERTARARQGACHLIEIRGLFFEQRIAGRRKPTLPHRARRIATRQSSVWIGKRGLISRRSRLPSAPASLRSGPSTLPPRARSLDGQQGSPAGRRASSIYEPSFFSAGMAGLSVGAAGTAGASPFFALRRLAIPTAI